MGIMRNRKKAKKGQRSPKKRIGKQDWFEGQ